VATDVAIYTRISQADPAEQTATHRQESACRAYAAAKGWEVVELYEDVDRSAYTGARRPAYDDMLERVAEGELGGVLVWKLDRLMRRPSDFEGFWSLCEQHRTMLASVTEPIDTSNELGLAIVRMLVTFASFESATKGIRTRAKLEELARAGEPPAHGRAVYGYTRGLREVVPEQAVVIQEAANRVIGGDSLTAIIRDWTARGVMSPKGAVWAPSSLRKLLLNPYLVGDRRYRGEVVATGCWPAILDRDIFERAGAALHSRFRPVGPPAHYLLTGLLRCGQCGGAVVGHGRPLASGRQRRYGCSNIPRSHCSGTYVLADRIEAWVLREYFSHLDSTELRTAVRVWRSHPPASDVPSIARLREDLKHLAREYYRDRAMDRPDYDALRQTLERRLANAETRANERTRLPLLLKLTGHGKRLGREWAGLPRARQRAALAAGIARIIIAPAGLNRRFRPDRFTIEWTLPMTEPATDGGGSLIVR
jgi:DNA invertase Pin-like site-specific DNA recombinase